METPYCNTYMGLNLCCPSMTDKQIRDKIKRELTDIPFLDVKRSRAFMSTPTTPPPGASLFPTPIPKMKGVFQIIDESSEMINGDLDLD